MLSKEKDMHFRYHKNSNKRPRRYAFKLIVKLFTRALILLFENFGASTYFRVTFFKIWQKPFK